MSIQISGFMLEYSLGVMNERKPGHPENEPAGNCRELRVDILNHQNSELTSCRCIVTVADGVWNVYIDKPTNNMSAIYVATWVYCI